MKNILLSVIGLSPQVLTEALYALFQQGMRVDEIHVITTATGKDLVHSGLLASGEGAFFKFLDEYEIDPEGIDFAPSNIHVLKDENGYELDDIVTPEDNEILVRKCMELSWSLTSSDDQAVFFMIAGGRKTMSASLALAAQFYGRPCDRIYHVLVSPEFEGCRDFYFPPKENMLIRTKDKNGSILFRQSKDARIWLVSMPFVSVRERLTQRDLDAPAHPNQLLMSLIRDNPPGLVLHLRDSKISFRGRELDLRPSHMAILAFFAKRRKECGCGGAIDSCMTCTISKDAFDGDPGVREEIRGLFESIIEGGRFPMIPNLEGDLSLDYANFASYRSKLNGCLEKTFGQDADKIGIASIGPRNEKRYGMRMEPQYIEIY